MNLATKAASVVAASIALAGCAQDPRMMESFAPIQSVSLSDPQKSCQQLANEIAVLDRDIATMDFQIAQKQRDASMMMAMGAMSAFNSQLAGMNGVMVADNSMMANAARTDANSSAQQIDAVKATYQERRNVLSQGFFNKGCRVRT